MIMNLFLHEHENYTKIIHFGFVHLQNYNLL